MNVIKIPEYWERPQRVFGVWTLRKNKRKAICELWTHPIGGEIRVEVSGELVPEKTLLTGPPTATKIQSRQHRPARKEAI
jgi:hypothetical protein